MEKLFTALKNIAVMLLVLSVITGCSTGGLEKAPASSSDIPPTTGKGSITFTVVKSSDPNTSTTSISKDSPAIVKATAKDSTGAVLAGKVMSFSSKFDINFSPVSGTALTDSNGTAAITIMVGATAGAAIITASISDNAGTVITNDTGITVNLQAPPVPTGVTATVDSSTQITLSWTNSGGALATGYKIYKNGTLLGAAAATSIVDSGLTASTLYCYSVSATDISGNESAKSSTVCGTTDGATTTGFVNLLTSSPQVGSDGLSTVTLTAIVKTANNVALKDKAVTFASNSGTLVVTRGTTDASGSATAALSAASDKSKRTITITAKTDSITSTTSVDVVGTTLQITGQNSLVSGTSAKLALFLKDSAGATIPGQKITLTSSLGNSFDQNPVSTSANGQAEVTYKATVGGTDTVTASALGATATQTISISTTDFIFTTPPSGTEISIGNAQTVTVHYALSGVPQTGKTVNFSTTRGTITPLSAVTDGSGNASAYLSSPTAGQAIITATTAGAGTIQTPVEFVATTASSMSLQATPSTISTNSVGSTVEQSTIIAIIRDSAGNLVKNKTVRFSLTDVSGGYVKQASDVTNSQGMASTTYISSISPSVKNGVRINASVDGYPAVTGFTTLTVASKPIYVVFGTGNKIEEYSATQYRASFVALVTDIAGNPQAGVTVTASLTPMTYLKGSYTGCAAPADKFWQWSPATNNNGTYLECANEDNNPVFFGGHQEWLLNGFLDKEPAPSSVTEDINGDGILTPGNVAEVNRTATTDANGFAQFYVIYAKQFANWAKVSIEGRIYSYGDQALGTTQFYLPVLRDDVGCTATPPGSISPFGLGASPNNVCTTSKASEVKPPANVTATTLSPSQIRISWTAADGATGYRIYRDANPVPLKSVVSTSTVDSGLTANTLYCYAVSGYSVTGVESAKSSQVCATTQLTAPPTPIGLTATGSTNPLKVTLTWTTSAGAAVYRIYRDGGVTPVVTVSAPGVTAVDTSAGLLPKTGYCYTISAVDVAGNESAQSTAACTSTSPPPPPAPTGLTVTAATSTQINLSWTASAGAVLYKIYKDGTYLKSVTTTSASDMGLTASTSYCYSISATDSSANESAQTGQLCATTYGPPPPDPTGLTASAVSPTQVNLSWTVSAGASQYKIYRNGILLASTASTSYSDNTASANTQYIYSVTAIGATGSESSGQTSQKTANTGLTIPSISSVTANSSTKITVSWTNTNTTAGSQVAGYKVYRNGSFLTNVYAAATLSFVDSIGLTPGTQYCYSISATDSSGNETAKSSTLCATTPATVAGSMVLSLTKSSDGTSTTSVSIDSPAKLTATVKDSVGSPIVGTVVSFSTTSDLTFNPASGTALTDATGAVTITVNAGNTTGATTIRAVTTDASGTAISGIVNLSVTPPNLSLSALTITPATISAGGSAGVSITVKDGSGNPYMTSVPISFTSDGVQASKATITPQVYTVNGVASATYRDINYASIDTITATLSIGGTTFTKTGTITVNAASAGSISFVSATPANIALKGTGGTGRSETSVVVFKVLDTNGNPISKKVNFLLNTTVGGLDLTADSADSDPVTGLVQTIVQAGTVSTPVRVSATIDGTTISTVSDQLVVSTGIPDQDSFSIAASKLNIDGGNYDGETSDITVMLADHFNNPVPDGTAVYFRSSGGSIQPSCTTGPPVHGVCTVTFTSQAPRPASGRVRILAYALGEESFVDLNGNGIYNTGDAYTDMPEPYLDANENGVRDASEEFVDTNANGSYSPGDGVFNGILRDASISGPTTIHVRNSLTVVLSFGSNAVIKIDGSTSPPARTIPPCTTAAPFTPGSVSFNVVVADVNGNVMPAGTTISFSTTNGTILTTPATYIVPNTNTTSPPTYPVTIQSDATQSGTIAPYTCTNTKQSGIFTVTVTTPKGSSSYQYITIND